MNAKTVIERSLRKIGIKSSFFGLGIILEFLVMLYGVISNSDFVTGVGIIVMGIDVVALPFTTPETTAFLGYRKSKFVGRILGILLITVGLWVGLI